MLYMQNNKKLCVLIFIGISSAYVLAKTVSYLKKEDALPSVCPARNKKALIWGVTGQDGSYLAEFLLNKGYEVHGVVRRCSLSNTGRIDHISNNNCPQSKGLKLHYGDLGDTPNVFHLIKEIQPDEVYNLGAQSDVAISFEQPEYTADVDGLGALRILDAIRVLGLKNKTRFYQASTSELYGQVQEIPQRETTPFYPRSPYAVAKLFAYWITVNYREAYGIFACNGILFNHESPRRGEHFVTREITRAAAARACGKKELLYLGNLNAKRDWGYAPEYVEAMWLMLQQPAPDDYVVATGQTHSVREFVEQAFKEIGIEVKWQGSGIDEVGVDATTGEIIVKIDARDLRPAEVHYLIGDASKAKRILGWSPKVLYAELAKIMVQEDIKNYKRAYSV